MGISVVNYERWYKAIALMSAAHASDHNNLFIQGSPVARNFRSILRSRTKILPQAAENRAATLTDCTSQLASPSTPIIKIKDNKVPKKSKIHAL